MRTVYELGGEGPRRGDGVRRTTGERAGRRRHRAERVEQLADRRAVRGHVDVQPVHRAEDVPAVDLGDLQDLLAVGDGQVDRLAGQLAQALHRGPGQVGQVAEPVVPHREGREHGAGPEPSGAVALDQLVALEGLQQARGGRAGQADLVDQGGEAARLG